MVFLVIVNSKFKGNSGKRGATEETIELFSGGDNKRRMTI